MAFFLNIDFESHVALVAQIDEDGRAAIAGGGRYIVVRPGQAEIAFVVVDAYQGQGIGTILMRHLAILAHDGRPQRADCGGVAREHRNVESVQEVRLSPQPETGPSSRTSGAAAC